MAFHTLAMICSEHSWRGVRRHREIARCVTQLAALAWTAISVTAFAADADSPPLPATMDMAPVLQEVIVTGSRIAQPNMTSTSPIQVVTSKEIQLQGTSNIIDLMNNLPQNFQNSVADLSPTTNPLAAPGGISTADLRGLGPQRTLVLVDGRRLGVGDASTLTPTRHLTSTRSRFSSSTVSTSSPAAPLQSMVRTQLPAL